MTKPFLHFPTLSGVRLVDGHWTSALFVSYSSLVINFVLQFYNVAGYSPPIGLKSMQNTPFLVILRLIFALKAKKDPPFGLARIIGQGPDVNATRKTELG